MTNWESFQKLDKLKKDIDKNRDKKEVGLQQKFLKILLDTDKQNLWALKFRYSICLFADLNNVW